MLEQLIQERPDENSREYNRITACRIHSVLENGSSVFPPSEHEERGNGDDSGSDSDFRGGLRTRNADQLG